MFSLCIPTMNRYDDFLSKNLPKYLENECIDEIIITDENGEDIKKIIEYFPENKKLILIQNENRLGPLLNKLKACSYTKNEWIALIDSDNYADKNYFIVAKEFIEKNITEKNVILAPSKANPKFNYSHLSGFIYKKGNFTNNHEKEKKILELSNGYYIPGKVCMNTGNYIINKYLIDNLDLSLEQDNITYSSACDVIYLNTLLFEQLDLQMHIVLNLEYEHIVHGKSIYLETAHMFEKFNDSIYKRYEKLI
jgi:hypothetical protein